MVSHGLDNETSTGNCAIKMTSGVENIDDENNQTENQTYIVDGRLYLQNEMTLYAKWRPVNSANYKVVVWKQKVTDDKNASNADKHYSYYDYRLMENVEKDTVILDSAEYQALNYENLKNSSDSKIVNDFTGFHYSRTEVVVGSNTYDGSVAEERAKGVVSPDGSTVVNVYYDRDLMTINFIANSNSFYLKSDMVIRCYQRKIFSLIALTVQKPTVRLKALTATALSHGTR